MDEFTLADIKSDVRGLVSDTQYDEDLIAQAANWFINRLFSDYHLRMAESSDTITALQAATTVDFPSDMMSRISIYMTAPQVIDMNPNFMQYRTFMSQYANFATANQAQASTWTEFGKQMRLSAPLSSDHTFQIDYLRAPVKMVSDSDSCELLSIYSELVAKGTLIGIMRINEDYDEASEEEDRLEPRITAFVRNEGRGGGKVGAASVMPTNRGRKGGGYNAARDF